MRAQPENGGIRCGPNSKKMRYLGAGQAKNGGSLPRHIPILDIYVSPPPG